MKLSCTECCPIHRSYFYGNNWAFIQFTILNISFSVQIPHWCRQIGAVSDTMTLLRRTIPIIALVVVGYWVPMTTTVLLDKNAHNLPPSCVQLAQNTILNETGGCCLPDRMDNEVCVGGSYFLIIVFLHKAINVYVNWHFNDRKSGCFLIRKLPYKLHCN